MRIAGVTIPDNKQLAYSLPLIFGIGPTRAREILKQVGVAANKKGSEITSDEEQKIRSLAEGFTIEGELRREIYAVGVPMRRTVDGEVVAFNCGVPSFMVKDGQLENDIGPRLVALVRKIEGWLGLY